MSADRFRLGLIWFGLEGRQSDCWATKKTANANPHEKKSGVCTPLSIGVAAALAVGVRERSCE